MEHEFIKWLHLLGAALLFGTGLGSAFYKWYADRSGNLHTIAHTNRVVVIADWLFTTPAVIVQPITGIWLAHNMGISLTQPWVVLAFVSYIVAGACWLPVVWLQIKMRDLAQVSWINQSRLDATYYRYSHIWFWLGIPAFTAMIAVYFLMTFKPIFGL